VEYAFYVLPIIHVDGSHNSPTSSQSPDGELDGGQGYEGGERFGEVLIVFGQTAVAAEPREGSLDHPAAGQHDEPFHVIRTLDDLEPKPR
jgi:hypothetical protein